MGVMIKDDEASRGMKMKVSKENELMRSVLVHVVSVFICALVCCYSYWFPWFYCFINHFVWIYLPSVWPLVFGPKCMFIVANMIVLVVVSEWRETNSKTRNLHDDMYDEYLKRSRGPRRVLVYKKVERKPDAAVKKIYTTAIEIKKVEMAKEIVVKEEEKSEEIVEEFHEIIEETIIKTNDNISEDKNEEKVEEQEEQEANDSTEDCSSECESVEFDNGSVNDHDENVNNLKETKPAESFCQIGNAKRAEETRSSDDELNKRVEDFIARVNRRRWAEAEASNWLICSA